MSNDDPLFANLSTKRRRIAVTYELIRFQPDNSNNTIVRKVAKQLGYNLDANKSNTFIHETIKMYNARKKRLRESPSFR